MTTAERRKLHKVFAVYATVLKLFMISVKMNMNFLGFSEATLGNYSETII
jgi:hypothetical protein